ncbi:hypothetical protein BT96DRAFT_925723 [Gymnopus androsaceus JB14]|uniref:Uncharacterized protein n=1 Tax=Gymnopus androsaceus JB14 TaxID=1447944 RepID=A0A6A4GZ41_9AGAR|nr:hypothetical protein BT96DRAFT_925723 [Gymnopus androsaceus JB14]
MPHMHTSSHSNGFFPNAHHFEINNSQMISTAGDMRTFTTTNHSIASGANYLPPSLYTIVEKLNPVFEGMYEFGLESEFSSKPEARKRNTRQKTRTGSRREERRSGVRKKKPRGSADNSARTEVFEAIETQMIAIAIAILLLERLRTVILLLWLCRGYGYVWDILIQVYNFWILEHAQTPARRGTGKRRF